MLDIPYPHSKLTRVCNCVGNIFRLRFCTKRETYWFYNILRSTFKIFFFCVCMSMYTRFRVEDVLGSSRSR